jgi:hypothetical protein
MGGARRPDIALPGKPPVSTVEVGRAILDAMAAIAPAAAHA